MPVPIFRINVQIKTSIQQYPNYSVFYMDIKETQRCVQLRVSQCPLSLSQHVCVGLQADVRVHVLLCVRADPHLHFTRLWANLSAVSLHLLCFTMMSWRDRAGVIFFFTAPTDPETALGMTSPQHSANRQLYRLEQTMTRLSSAIHDHLKVKYVRSNKEV